MIKYILHEPENTNITITKCKNCNITMYINNKSFKFESQFSVQCLTEDEYIIKKIIE